VISRRRFLGGTAGGILRLVPATARAQEGVFLRPDEAARQLFPDASEIVERRVTATPDLQRRVRSVMGQAASLWEPTYQLFTVTRGDGRRAYVVVVEEIGKHRPITYAVAVNGDGAVHDLAVLTYREAYGGEVRERRFLRQYANKTLGDPMLPYRDIRNIAGATLSVQATGRAARKAIAVLKGMGLLS
jgi:FMN-binding domain